MSSPLPLPIACREPQIADHKLARALLIHHDKHSADLGRPCAAYLAAAAFYSFDEDF